LIEAKVNQKATCSEVWQKYPGLFTVTSLLADYTGMTQQQLTQHLMPSIRQNLSSVTVFILSLTKKSAGSKANKTSKS